MYEAYGKKVMVLPVLAFGGLGMLIYAVGTKQPTSPLMTIGFVSVLLGMGLLAYMSITINAASPPPQAN